MLTSLWPVLRQLLMSKDTVKPACLQKIFLGFTKFLMIVKKILKNYFQKEWKPVSNCLVFKVARRRNRLW